MANENFVDLLEFTRGAAGAARLATILDQEMLEVRGVSIASRITRDDDLPVKRGTQVFDELGGRYLIRYLLSASTTTAEQGIARRTYVTPTPYTPHDAIPMLMLPAEERPRTYAMLLDPRKFQAILGPRWVQGGFGIEYILPDGYTQDEVAIRPWSISLA